LIPHATPDARKPAGRPPPSVAFCGASTQRELKKLT
jgi:hypothetical protein